MGNRERLVVSGEVVWRGIRSLVVFAILMETGGGIVCKSPDYILEKANSALLMGDQAYTLLDSQNYAKYRTWCATWEGSF